MLSVHLANIKSSGIYRFVFDKSEVPANAPQTMRLVVGYSEKGPFNTVTYVKNASDFKEIYGDISKKLERYGCYFHRLALQCLDKEPILCLNLKPFGEEETVEYIKSTITAAISKDKEVNVKNIFDTTRLWTLSPETFGENVDGKHESFLKLCATDTVKNSNTVFIRPSLVKGYDITLRDWYNTYNNGDYPDYMENYLDTLVSDYFVDVFIFRGKITDPAIATSSTFLKYFTTDSKGNYVVKDTITNAYNESIDCLQALSQVDGSGFLAKYTGSLLPYFKGTDGSWLSIDLMVNNDMDRHQMMMYLDEEYLRGAGDPVKNINLGGYYKIKSEASAFDELLGSVVAGTIASPKYDYNVFDDTYKVTGKSSNAHFGDVAVDFIPCTNSTGDTTIEFGDNCPINKGDRFIGANGGLVTVIVKNGKQITFSGRPKSFTIPAAAKDTDPSTPTDTDTTSSQTTKKAAKAAALAADAPVTYIVRYNGKLLAHGDNTGTYIAGYTYNSKPETSKINDKNAWVNKILNVLADKGIREALTNDTDVVYRYIVDTFEGFPEDDLRARLASVAKEKGNAFVISNFPAMSTFAKSEAFRDTKTGLVSTKYIAAGSNSAVSSTDHISMPTDGEGASFIAFYTPLKYNDNGLKIMVPSAGLVSNNFMDKFTSRKPYYIVAGPTYGRMIDSKLVGPDYNFTRDDLDNLEPFGVNCMVYKPQRGTFINSNQTAKQLPVTALSKINVRELVIYLQDAIADMLQGYQWEMNTQTLRDNIKAKADAICEQIKSNGGLYDYTNVCDDTNNTAEVIDNEMVVLSTGIEPAKGAGKMVHELTIYRTGGLSSVVSNG